MKRFLRFTPHILTIALAIMTLPVHAANPATLSVSPSSSQVKVGETSTVTIRLNTGGHTISGVGLSVTTSSHMTIVPPYDESGSVFEQEVEPPVVTNGTLKTSRVTFGNGFNGTDGETFKVNVQFLSPGTGTISINQNETEVLPEDGSASVLGSVQSAQFTITNPDLSAPTFSPNGGDFAGQTNVTISAATGAQIFYTTDGTQPSPSSTLYAAPITIKSTTTLKALATKTDFPTSPVATALFTRTDEPHGTGTVMREYFGTISGNNVRDLTSHANFVKAPTSVTEPNLFEGPTGAGNDYGARYRGYITPPESGSYTFWIAGSTTAELWLSTDDQLQNKKKIAAVTSATTSREWEKSSDQKSTQIQLVGGQKYYIEALHKAGTGGDNLAVGWQLPSGGFERPIAGLRLTPYRNASISMVKSASVSAAKPGDTYTYIIAYTNDGNHAARNFTIKDMLSTDLTFVSASNSGQFANGEVTWAIPNTIASGATGTVTVNVTVK